MDFSQLNSLIEKKLIDPHVQTTIDLLATLDVKKYQNLDQYLTWKQRGIQIFVNGKNETIESIFLYNENKDGFMKYEGSLPFKLNMGMLNNEIVSILGEPDRKGGPPLINVWISYERLGIQFEFNTKKWDDLKIPIDFIILFKSSYN